MVSPGGMDLVGRDLLRISVSVVSTLASLPDAIGVRYRVAYAELARVKG